MTYEVIYVILGSSLKPSHEQKTETEWNQIKGVRIRNWLDLETD